MRRYWWLAGLFSLASIGAFSQNAAFNGFCTQGGKSTTTQGISSTNKAQIIIPSCTVTVFFTGTTTPVPSIFKDASGTPLTNPFTADNLNAIAPGKWLFYAASGPAYDVVMSGGIAPLTFTAPVTLTGLQVGGGGGGAGVTTVACDPAMGNLLGCTVSNPATTPVFHWSTNNQASHTVYGNFSGTSGPPFFANYTCTGLLTCAFTSGSNTINFNVPNTSALSITATLPIQVNGGAGPIASGTANISCPQCGSLQMTLVPPIAGQFALVPATASSIVYTGPGSTLNPSTVTNTSANVTVTQYPNAFPPSSADAVLTNFTLPSFINPANVTAIYLVGFSSCTAGPFGASYAVSVNGISQFGCAGNSALTQFSNLTSLTGSTIAASTVDALVSRTQPTNPGAMNIPLIEYMVFYTGTPPPAPSSGVNVLPPLYYTSDGNALGITLPFDVGTDIGAANAYNVNTPNYANWQVGTEIKFVPLHANTGASTIRFSTTQPSGLFSLVKAGGTPLVAGDIVTSVPAIVLFTNSGSAVAELENPQTGGGGGGSGITALTADVTATGPGSAAATVKGLNGVPFCTGFTPTNGQGVQYTTGSSPNPCYTAATSSGSIPNTTQILAGNGSGAAVSTALDDGHTTASTITSTEPIAVVVAGGQGGTVDLTEGTAPSATSGHDILYADSAAHCIKNANNGGSFACLGAGGGGGGYTNVTGSVSQTTVAQINSAGASGTYYATTPLSIATGGTVTVPVQFSQAGLWTIASGQTVTFSQIVTETDSPHQHFAGSGTVVLSAQDAPVEWFGAVGFTTQSAAIAGTDSLASINTCFSSLTSGQCKLQALWYRTTAAMTVANSGVGLAGASTGGVIGNGGTGATPSAIVLTSASADILDVGSLTAFIYNNAFNDFSLFRSAFGTGTAAGIRMIKCASCIITRTYSNDSVYNYYLEGTPAYGSGGIFNNGAQWGYNGFTPSGTVHGFFIDTTVAPQSTQLNYNIAANATGTLTTATGFECNGASGGCVDIMGTGNQTAQLGTGVSVTNPSDFHWTQGIDDQCNLCVLVTGGSASQSAEFDGGWEFSNLTAAVDLETVTNVTIKGKLLRSSNSITNLVLVHSSNDVIIANNIMGVGAAGVNQINLNGTSASVISGNNILIGNSATCITLAAGSNGNTVTGNQCSTGNTSNVGIAIAGSNNNSVFSNTLNMSGSTTGITADASSNNNHYLNMNTIVTSGTAISDANPSTNQFALSTGLSGMTATQVPIAATASTVTSSKPLAGSGAGISTGPTSSTNLDCVQFSGTTGQISDSGAPCAGGGASGALTNITSTITPTNCTVSGSSCAMNSSVNTITFAAIPGTFNHVQVKCTVAAVGSGAAETIHVQLNGDSTGSHYGEGDMNSNSAAGANVLASNISSVGYWELGQIPSATSAPSWASGIGFELPYYSRTTFFKSYGTLFPSIQTNNGTTTQTISKMNSGQFLSTAAITSIRIFTGSGNNFVTGSECSIYGIL